MAAALGGVLSHGWRRARGTTLRAPLVWAGISSALLAVMSLSHEATADSAGRWSAVAFVLGVETLCPLVAVLGAKRPQDRGWQWVVVSLWAVLAWPGLQAIVMPVGPQFELFAAWKLFVCGLIVLGPLNYLPTRYWLSALLVALGQSFLLTEPLGLGGATGWHLPLCLLCFLSAAVWAKLRGTATSKDPLTRRWLRFRDMFGAFWAMRIQQRVNEIARLRDWPVQLTWVGFEAVHGDPSDAQITEIDKSLDTLLRRFV